MAVYKTSISVNKETYMDFKIKCMREGKQVSEVLNQLMSSYEGGGTEQVTIPQPKEIPQPQKMPVINEPVTPKTRQEFDPFGGL
jgi:hypothetical protein